MCGRGGRGRPLRSLAPAKGRDEAGERGGWERAGNKHEGLPLPPRGAVGTPRPPLQSAPSLNNQNPPQPQPARVASMPPTSLAHSDRSGTDQDLDFRTLDVEGLSRKLSNRISLSMCSARGSCSWS